MLWLHLNDHWWFFLTFIDFILKRVFHVCLKENTVPICPDTELSFSTGAEMSWCQTVLFAKNLRSYENVQKWGRVEQSEQCQSPLKSTGKVCRVG